MFETLKITLRNTDNNDTRDVYWKIKQHKLGQKWAQALKDDYLDTDAKIDKQFMLHGWIYPETKNKKSIAFMCEELNFHIKQFNAYCEKHNIDYHVDLYFEEENLSQDLLNKIHHHFEILIGQIWDKSEWLDQFDQPHQFSINNFNWLCHEIESQLRGIKAAQNNRSSSSIVFCMNPIIRHDLVEEDGDYDHFVMGDLDWGQLRMHYAQTGKTHREAYHDGDEDIYDSNISGIRYLSGEFDINLNCNCNPEDWEGFQTWLEEKQINLSDKKLSLGYTVLGDIDKTKSIFVDDNMVNMRELWKYDDVLSMELLDVYGESLASKSWNYTWLDWYNQKKSELEN
tara:strand:- start:15956 stop:16978 length:1023 start_codon:yes stop_codon:yes gene_type:complete